MEVRVLSLPNEQQIMMVRDITERRRAEEALRESEARKCAILGSALDAIMDLDNDGRVTEMNPAAERMFGCSAANLTGRYLADLVFPASEREIQRRELAFYFATGQGPLLNNRVETVAMRADGTAFPIELVILVEGVADRSEIVVLAERIAEAFRSLISLAGHELFVTASIGIALATPGQDDAEGLLRKADLAMYRSKAAGKSQHTIFDQSMNAAALERLQLGSDLHTRR